jgi:hypothetical protein
VADPCSHYYFAEHLPTGWFAQQKLWSNQAGGCVAVAAKDALPLYKP